MTGLQLDTWRVFVTPLPGTVRTATPELWRDVVAHAVLAPSVYNTQPWRFRIRAGALELRPDLSRALPVCDPVHRQLVMSCGAALENVRLVLAARGVAPRIELLPDVADPFLLARVRTGSFRPPSALEQSLRNAIPLRRTTRSAFSSADVSQALIEQLQRVAMGEGVRLERVTDADRAAIATLVADGTRLHGNDPAFREELAYWTRCVPAAEGGASSIGDGLSMDALGLPMSLGRAGLAAVRRVPWGSVMAMRDRRLATRAAAVVLVSTPRDAARDWLAAGMSLQRILLLETASGLTAGFFDQSIAVPMIRERLRDRLGLASVPQSLLRLGVAREVAPSRRRAIGAVLAR